MKCKGCKYWNNQDTGFEDEELGECRRYPPVIVDSIYERQVANNMELEEAIWIASSYPVTPHMADGCGEYKVR